MCDAIIQQHWRLVEYTLHVYGVAEYVAALQLGTLD